MDSKDQETRGTSGKRPAHPGYPEPDVTGYDVTGYEVTGYDVTEYEVAGYHVHTHSTMVSQLGKEPECREALDRLYHYLDGELTESRRRQIKDHLDTCMPCLEAFDFEAELKMLIARRCRDEVPIHLRLRVIQALSAASTGVAGEETADDEMTASPTTGTSGLPGREQGGPDDERTGAGGEGADRFEADRGEI